MAKWVKKSACNAGNMGHMGSILGSGRSSAGGHGYPLQYSFAGKIPWTEGPAGYSP